MIVCDILMFILCLFLCEDPYLAIPLKAEIPQTSRLLNVQGQFVSQADYDAEEGEILPYLSREQIAEILQIPVDDVIIDEEDQSFVPPPEPEQEPVFETDDIEIEDETDQHYPAQEATADVPDFAELFRNANAEEVTQRASAREQVKTDFDLDKYLGDRKSKQEEREERRRKYLRFLERQAGKEKKVPVSTEYNKFYQTLGKKTDGAIVAWCYIAEFNVYAVKRERGVEYFERANDLQTLPFYDIRQLARLNLLDCQGHGKAEWFETLVKRESRFGWKNLKPYIPGVKSHPTKIDPLTGRKFKILNCKAPKCLKKLPLKSLPTGWSARFKWWYFNEKTTEAVIVLDDDTTGGETIRVFDPMWIKTFGKDDITVLYYNPILYKVNYMDLALQFQKVVRICFAFDIYAGSEEVKSTSV